MTLKRASSMVTSKCSHAMQANQYKEKKERQQAHLLVYLHTDCPLRVASLIGFGRPDINQDCLARLHSLVHLLRRGAGKVLLPRQVVKGNLPASNSSASMKADSSYNRPLKRYLAPGTTLQPLLTRTLKIFKCVIH